MVYKFAADLAILTVNRAISLDLPEVRGRPKAFADTMRAAHSLRRLCVRYEGFDHERPRKLRRLQNVLEPLSSIYAVEHVGIEGACEDFAAKLNKAMQTSSLVAKEIPDAYGTRMVRKPEPKRIGVRYRLGPF
ncbi:MAG: hypothetical protein Q9197_002277 [Variospora fuerteventurae]